MDAIEQQFRRMAFNIVARNQDDHVKNIAFLMDKSGELDALPAFDLTLQLQPLRCLDVPTPDVHQRQTQ